MSDQDHPQWPTSDDDLPPRRPPSLADESTKRIQFPLIDPDVVARRQRPQPGYPPPEPPRAAPMRIGPQPEPPRLAEPEPEPAGRSRRGLIILGAVALVVVVAAGVVFAVPSLREKIGFGEAEPEVVIQSPPSAVAFTPKLRGPAADAPVPSAAGVKAALAGPAAVPALGNLTGTVLDAATGAVLWEQKPTTQLVPASTAKILTASAALLKLDHGQQLVTRVVAGKDPGTAVLVGGGDPTLNSLPVGKNSLYLGAAHLDDLVAQVKASGKVTQIFYDVSRYAVDPLAQGWLPGDVAAGYITPIVPAMMDGGRADPTKEVSPRSANPARTVATELAKRLGATVAAKPDVTTAPDAKVLGEVRSAPLTELVNNFLQTSDNVLAEMVAREVAKAIGEEPSFAGVSRSTLRVLQEAGFDTSGAVLIDGSGLSTVDHLSAKLLASVLAVAAGPDGKDPRTAKLRPLLSGLPVAGGSGTLAGRFLAGAPAAAGRGWVRAKTGTLSGVNSLAGEVLDADGRLLVFSLMTSGTDAGVARPALDAVAAALRACGCT